MQIMRRQVPAPIVNFKLRRNSLLSGLGQDDSVDDSGDDTSTDLSTLPLTSLSPLPVDLSPIDTTDSLGFDLSLPTATSSDDTLTNSILSATSNGSSSITPAQLATLIAAGGQTLSAALKSTQSPYVIPGTSLVYNPATGQITGTGVASTAAASAITSLGSMLPLIGVVLVAGFLLESIGGKK